MCAQINPTTNINNNKQNNNQQKKKHYAREVINNKIFTHSILGMNLFGCKFCDKTDGDDDTQCDRKNFDSLLWALVTVFQVKMQNWIIFNNYNYIIHTYTRKPKTKPKQRQNTHQHSHTHLLNHTHTYTQSYPHMLHNMEEIN